MGFSQPDSYTFPPFDGVGIVSVKLDLDIRAKTGQSSGEHSFEERKLPPLDVDLEQINVLKLAVAPELHDINQRDLDGSGGSRCAVRATPISEDGHGPDLRAVGKAEGVQLDPLHASEAGSQSVEMGGDRFKHEN